MTRQKSISTFTSILMIFIFLASIVCNSVNLANWSSTNTQEEIGVKKESTPTKSEKQLPEKVEVENDVKANHFFFIQELGEFIQLNITKSQSAFIHNAFRFRGNTSGTPLFLVKRSILI
jgi:hypothetical protein